MPSTTTRLSRTTLMLLLKAWRLLTSRVRCWSMPSQSHPNQPRQASPKPSLRCQGVPSQSHANQPRQASSKPSLRSPKPSLRCQSMPSQSQANQPRQASSKPSLRCPSMTTQSLKPCQLSPIPILTRPWRVTTRRHGIETLVDLYKSLAKFGSETYTLI